MKLTFQTLGLVALVVIGNIVSAYLRGRRRGAVQGIQGVDVALFAERSVYIVLGVVAVVLVFGLIRSLILRATTGKTKTLRLTKGEEVQGSFGDITEPRSGIFNLFGAADVADTENACIVTNKRLMFVSIQEQAEIVERNQKGLPIAEQDKRWTEHEHAILKRMEDELRVSGTTTIDTRTEIIPRSYIKKIQIQVSPKANFDVEELRIYIKNTAWHSIRTNGLLTFLIHDSSQKVVIEKLLAVYIQEPSAK